jgi:hypothetical protein
MAIAQVGLLAATRPTLLLASKAYVKSIWETDSLISSSIFRPGPQFDELTNGSSAPSGLLL